MHIYAKIISCSIATTHHIEIDIMRQLKESDSNQTEDISLSIDKYIFKKQASKKNTDKQSKKTDTNANLPLVSDKNQPLPLRKSLQKKDLFQNE